jgi:hypothetical protein
LEVGEETIFGYQQGFQHSRYLRKIGKFPHFLRWEERLSLEARIFNTAGTFHLLANTCKENMEISAFLEVGEESKDTLWTP